MKINDKMRLEWIANNIATSRLGDGPVNVNFINSFPPHDIFAGTKTGRLRKAVDAAIRAEKKP